ncbi:MAG: fibronectin type III domain-containing protein [Parcubacteria group bacterium]|jgi:hypothetical protein
MGNENFRDKKNFSDTTREAGAPAREVDVLAKDVRSLWGKAFIFIRKKNIKTWQGIFAVAFSAGVVAALILAVNYNIQTKTGAANGTATLTWSANAELDLAGYRIYYGTTKRTAVCPAGGYASKIDAGKATSYTVNGLTEGQTYYFSTTSYDTSGNESCFSSEVTKTIPISTTTCTVFNYSVWGDCQADGTQTRTLTDSMPAGCTGGAPSLARACTYTPPVTTVACVAHNYSNWSSCVNRLQNRTVTASFPVGCTGGLQPVLSRACKGITIQRQR